MRRFALDLCLAAIAVAVLLQYTRPWEVLAPRKVTIAQASELFVNAPLYVAVDARLFRGLDVSIVSTGSDDETWAALVGGRASFGVSDPMFAAASARQGNEHGRTVAGLANGVPLWGVTREAATPIIRNPGQLKGQTVATLPNPSSAYVLQRQMFKDGGIAPNIRSGAFGALLAMLDAGQVSIALESEPNVSDAIKRGARIVYSMPDIYGDLAVSGLTARVRTLESDPVLVDAVLCGLQQSLDYMRKNPEATADLLTTRFRGLGRDVAMEALQRITNQKVIPEDLVVSPSSWSRTVRLRVRVGQLRPSGSYDSYVDPRAALSVRSRSDCRIRSDASEPAPPADQ